MSRKQVKFAKYWLLFARTGCILHAFVNSRLRKIMLDFQAEYDFSRPAQKILGSCSPWYNMMYVLQGWNLTLANLQNAISSWKLQEIFFSPSKNLQVSYFNDSKTFNFFRHPVIYNISYLSVFPILFVSNNLFLLIRLYKIFHPGLQCINSSVWNQQQQQHGWYWNV